MDDKTYTIISDKGRGAIVIKQSRTGESIAIVFFNNIKDNKGRLLSDIKAYCQIIKAEKKEKAYIKSCDWVKRNINQECEFEEGHKFIDTVNYIIKSMEN